MDVGVRVPSSAPIIYVSALKASVSVVKNKPYEFKSFIGRNFGYTKANGNH